MRIVGFSGLDRSVPFKRERFPGLAPGSLRIAQGFDSAAALVVGGEVRFAAAEERFTREKATGAFPVRSIEAALASAGLAPGELDRIAHGFDYGAHEAFFRADALTREAYDEVYAPHLQAECWARCFPGVDWASKLVAVPHHLAHAASTFYTSGFEDALVLVSDGMGEVDSMSAFAGSAGGLEPVLTVPALHSLGMLYSAFTMFAGFRMNMDEYKLMGLAPHGESQRYYAEILSLVELRPDGDYAIPLLAANRSAEQRESYEGVLEALESRFGRRRAPAPGQRAEQRIVDLAAGIQAVLQTVQLHALKRLRARTGLDRLCLAGGVALNCSANGVILRSGLFERVHVQPAAGDDGTALGAAIYVARLGDSPPPSRAPMPFFGPGYDRAAILAALDETSTALHRVELGEDALLAETVARLARGEILGWFQGRMEFGPRALGARSILADPAAKETRDRVNMKIKKREGFRPFAPAVAERDAARLFQIRPGDEPMYEHMLFVTLVRDEFRSRLEAVVHVDDSARVQVVTAEGHPRFHALLERYGDRTGLAVLLNTSFNVNDQPIVCTPREAIDTFLAADLDALVIGDFVVTRAGEGSAASAEGAPDRHA